MKGQLKFLESHSVTFVYKQNCLRDKSEANNTDTRGQIKMWQQEYTGKCEGKHAHGEKKCSAGQHKQS